MWVQSVGGNWQGWGAKIWEVLLPGVAPLVMGPVTSVRGDGRVGGYCTCGVGT